MSAKARVLIVDSSEEVRDVLRTLLERQGAETLVAAEARHATEIARREQPDVIIFDAECDYTPSKQATVDLGQTASRNNIPIVVLGTVKRPLSPLPTGQFVSKPYHYAPLIRRIEELLGNRAPVCPSQAD